MPGSEAVSDTGPLISLEKLPGGFSLLKRLFIRLYLPTEVFSELQAGYAGDYLHDFGLERLVEVVDGYGQWGRPHSDRLDPGERAAIGLAIQRGYPLLIEERQGRRIARENGVMILGTAGLLRVARLREILTLDEAMQALETLHASGRIGKRLLEEMLGELRRV